MISTSTLGGIEARLAAVRAEKSRLHFPTYCAYVHNRPLYAHQLVWNDLWDDPSEEDIAIIAPPGTFKSSLLCMKREWTLGRSAMLGEDRYSLYLMNVAEQAEKQVMAIEETIENNPRYRQVFPWVQPDKDKGWTKQVVFIRGRKGSDKEPNIFGTGFLGPYQGYHFHDIDLDDITDPEDVMSETVMESQRYRLRGMLRDRKRKEGRIRAIMNPWGPNDLRHDMKEMGFRVIEFPIERQPPYPWGRLLFPEMFGDDRLEELQRVKGHALYNLSYMLREEAAEGNLIKREWFKMFNQEPEFILLKVQVWDIAITEKETGDYSCCGTWGIAKNGYYLLDVVRKRVESPELIHWLPLMAERVRPDYVLILTAGVGKPVYQMLRANTHLNLLEAPAEAKEATIRLREVLPIIEAGRVWVRAGAPWVTGFLDECARYTGHQGGHDDQVAMLSGSLRWLKDHERGEHRPRRQIVDVEPGRVWRGDDDFNPFAERRRREAMIRED